MFMARALNLTLLLYLLYVNLPKHMYNLIIKTGEITGLPVVVFGQNNKKIRLININLIFYHKGVDHNTCKFDCIYIYKVV